MRMRAEVVFLVASTLAASLASAHSLTVNSGAAMGGSNGLEVTCNPTAPNNNNVYILSDEPNAETHFRATFLIRPGELELQTDKAVRYGAIDMESGAQSVLLFLKKSDTDGAWQAKLKYESESTPGTFRAVGNLFLTTIALPQATKMLEIEYQKDSSEGATDGFIRMRRCEADGTSCSSWRTSANKEVQNGPYDNDDSTVDSIRFGILGGSGNLCESPYGGFDFDEFASYR